MKKVLLFSLLALVLSFTLFGCSASPSYVAHNLDYVENDECVIELSHDKAKKGEEITFTVTDITLGYEVDKVTANGYIVDDFKFIMPNEEVMVEVHLKEANEETPVEEGYKVNIEANEYALITTDKARYEAGETVKIDYNCKGNYVLDKLYVDGNVISGMTFTMPNKDVTITGTFIDAIKDTPWQLELYSATNAARSYWYFSYGETGLNIKVIVDDRILWPSPYKSGTGYKDNVEFILGAKTTSTGYETNKTLKFLVAFDGGNYVQVASSATAWANKSLAKTDYTVSVSTKSIENKQGYNGYEVNMFVSYAALGLTKANAVGNITTCIAMRNTNGHANTSTAWASYTTYNCVWKNPSTHLIINADGTIGRRS